MTAPTVAGLAAENVALRARVARVEALLGIVTDDTLADLEWDEALAVVGGDSSELDGAVTRVKKRRAQQ